MVLNYIFMYVCINLCICYYVPLVSLSKSRLNCFNFKISLDRNTCYVFFPLKVSWSGSTGGMVAAGQLYSLNPEHGDLKNILCTCVCMSRILSGEWRRRECSIAIPWGVISMVSTCAPQQKSLKQTKIQNQNPNPSGQSKASWLPSSWTNHSLGHPIFLGSVQGV